MRGAVAIDLGASSARYAAGRLVDGRIEFEVIRQIPHAAKEVEGQLRWDTATLLGFCREAVQYAEASFDEATVGIDSWGVDHGFLDESGRLIADPVCYRDHSHLAAFESLAGHRRRLYELTGCQHQPFNTICQLMARASENPSLRARRWLILPDLFGHFLTGKGGYELTQASTTQLLGLDGRWSAEAFEIAGWPMPGSQPFAPGTVIGDLGPRTRLVSVGSHDTGSAVCGFGALGDHQAFLNVGTWSLFGALLDRPMATREAEDAAYSNERAVDGRVRFLKNIPGFYVINRIHEELDIRRSVPEWLDAAESVDDHANLMAADFFNPESMSDTVAAHAGFRPRTDAQWAGLALTSLARTIAEQPRTLELLTGRRITELRVGGGGSQSRVFCDALSRESGLSVVTGAVEATVLGNLAMQFLAAGRLRDQAEVQACIQRSNSA